MHYHKNKLTLINKIEIYIIFKGFFQYCYVTSEDMLLFFFEFLLENVIFVFRENLIL